MKLLLRALATFVLLNGVDSVADESFQKCNVTGGPHGKEFDDSNATSRGLILRALRLCGVDFVDGIGVTIWDLSVEENAPFHGLDQNCRDVQLSPYEYITSVEFHSAKIDSETRVGFIRLLSQENKTYEIGKMSNRGKEGISECTAPEGYQLAGFYGRSEDKIFALGALWGPLPEKWPLQG
uniref:Secreted RxLR effector protein 19 n=1 Tax=Plasmopara viticola TaxID=143451 RepID=RLR19_PLAVT|nr:RecName: Full=Secreted RxLR effector protein 19; Flags: Precursor [Plasmopara viticola]ANC73374.1 secreted RxLR effector peptide protein 19 [Plasmopara viticola]